MSARRPVIYAKAATFYRDVARSDRERAAEYRAKADAAPIDVPIGPCPAFPQGWVSHPRANLTEMAESAERSAAAYDALADRLMPQVPEPSEAGSR